MFSDGRRRFLGGLAILAGRNLLERPAWPAVHAAGQAGRISARSDFWCADAGDVKVSQGPWSRPDTLSPGVHFESLRLRMPDGVDLTAQVYLPAGVRRGEKVPATLITDPYRREPRGDGAGDLDFQARDGYAAVYVDVRGSGGSEGMPTDEYSPEEYEDTTRIIAWLSRQEWSNGSVGMYGISYSAFNSLWMAAAIRPPALKAIFLRAGTDDRYTDDVHYPGGAMVMVNHAWALGMLTSNATPGAPDYDLTSRASLVRWDTAPWLQGFIRQQVDGPYWRRGSLAPDYQRLTTPTFLAGGTLDKYQNFVPRIMKSSPAVTKGVLGPWHHSMTWPGPVLDWRALRARWFDHWLKGRDTGMLAEPRLSFYMPEWQRQTFRYRGAIPGQWKHLDEWPDTALDPKARFYLQSQSGVSAADAPAGDWGSGQGGALSESSPPASSLTLRYHPGRGGSDQSFGPTGGNGYYGIDSRDEDPFGLCFDTPPLRDPVEILGFVRANLFVSSTAPLANWIVRLHDLAPDGTSYLVTRGFLNGCHRRSHTRPERLTPGEVYEMTVETMCAAYKFPAGHRIRVIVTNADFPVIWPSPYAMTTTLYTGGDRPSHVLLPVLQAPRYRSSALPVLADSIDTLQQAERAADSVADYQLTRNYASGVSSATFRLTRELIECRVNERNPAEASVRVTASAPHRAADGRSIETRAEGTLRSTLEHFLLDMECTLLENGKVVRTRRWKDEVRREFI
jgi:putative CocE/NonD family hydrolase